jgi:hypothetical protein
VQHSKIGRSTSETGQNENPPFTGLCQLRPAADIGKPQPLAKLQPSIVALNGVGRNRTWQFLYNRLSSLHFSTTGTIELARPIPVVESALIIWRTLHDFSATNGRELPGLSRRALSAAIGPEGARRHLRPPTHRCRPQPHGRRALILFGRARRKVRPCVFRPDYPCAHQSLPAASPGACGVTRTVTLAVFSQDMPSNSV